MQKHYDRGDTRAYPSCNLKNDDAKLEEAKSTPQLLEKG